MRSPVPRLLLAALVLVACDDPSSGPDLRSQSSPAGGISVVTRNVFVGADVDAVLVALLSPDPNDDFDALLTAIQTFINTDFPTRAVAFADEIARNRPHVVGLQEVSDIYINLTGYGLPLIDVGFLPILQAALADRDLHYAIGAQVAGLQASLLGGAISLVDYDVVLYDADRVAWQTVVAKNFEYNVGEVAPGVLMKRNWIAGTATLDDVVYTVVSTHPQDGGDGIPDHPLALLRQAQLYEIVTSLGTAAPAIVMGDLNDLPGSPMYHVLTGAGFLDAWAELRPDEPGYTCCHVPDLSNAETQFTKRIDYVFARGLDRQNGGLQGTIRRLGEVAADRIQGPAYLMWPSDHAGVAVLFVTPPANGLFE